VSTFDVNEFQFEIKEDQFGLGYNRLDVNNLLGTSKIAEESPAANLLFPMAANLPKVNKKGIAGQAFGVGDFEDDDDIDVYKQDSMEQYDFDLNNKNTKKMLNKSYGFGVFEDDILILKKYSTSKKKQEPAKVFPGPKVPLNFNLNHKFPDSETTDVEAKNKENDAMNLYLKSVSERSEVLGEKPIQPDSVFDLLKPTDREFLQKQREKREQTIEVPIEAQIAENQEKINEKQSKAKRYEDFVANKRKNYDGKNEKKLILIKFEFILFGCLLRSLCVFGHVKYDRMGETKRERRISQDVRRADEKNQCNSQRVDEQIRHNFNTKRKQSRERNKQNK